MALMAYRKDLPVTMRSCFYPLLGDKVMGPFGDAIDVISAVSTVFGVCTSLGIGVMDLSQGISRLTGCDTLDNETCSATPACLWKDFGLCKSKQNYCSQLGTVEQCQLNASVCSWNDSLKESVCDSRLKMCSEGLLTDCTGEENSTDYLIGFQGTTNNLVMLVWIISAV